MSHKLLQEETSEGLDVFTLIKLDKIVRKCTIGTRFFIFTRHKIKTFDAFWLFLFNYDFCVCYLQKCEDLALKIDVKVT